MNDFPFLHFPSNVLSFFWSIFGVNICAQFCQFNNFIFYRVAEFSQHVFNEILAEYSTFVGTRESCVELIRKLDTENIFQATRIFRF